VGAGETLVLAMGPRAKDYSRASRRVQAALEQPAATPHRVIEDFLGSTWDLLGVTSSCWHQTDPSSGLPVSSSVAGEPPGSLEWSLEFEYARPDVSRFADLRARRSPVASISSETGGAMGTSARYREMIEPSGPADELRIAFRDVFGMWASLVVFTDRAMTPRDLRFALEAVPAGSAALRVATARVALATPVSPAPNGSTGATHVSDPGGPSVVILDAADAIVAADAASRERLKALPEDRDVTVPGVVSCLAAQARGQTEAARATARMRTLDGRWFELDASVMPENPGSVAVVIAPAGPDGIREALLRALGLSARERQVARLSAHGQSAKEMARELQISPWTVQDHLKAVYAKTGATCRGDLGAMVLGCSAF
jgi:DNA-binding CsgD family transcriptional regulator